MDSFPRHPSLRSQDMPEDVKAKLEKIIDRLKPSDLLDQARAVVLDRILAAAVGFADGEDDEDDASDALKRLIRSRRRSVAGSPRCRNPCRVSRGVASTAAGSPAYDASRPGRRRG